MDRFARTFVVRWADCDMNGHLRNTCYSEYAIEVRMAFMADGGFGLEEMQRHGIGEGYATIERSGRGPGAAGAK